LAALFLACLVLTVAVEGPLSYIRRTADQALDPAQYITAVLGPERAP
jgi:formate hydrogenlyase subunit 3/multisubunit Na+/H+ antiporter MnhD subunit